MRDIVRVIDAVLAEIPDEEDTMEVRLVLRGMRRRAFDTAPEAIQFAWKEANSLLVGIGTAYSGDAWTQRVADIWSGRTEVQS